MGRDLRLTPRPLLRVLVVAGAAVLWQGAGFADPALPELVSEPAAPDVSPRPMRGPDALSQASIGTMGDPIIGLNIGVERPMPRRRPEPACTADGRHCISPFDFTSGVCRTIEAAASENGLDPHFLMRLLWRESLFDPYAVSHVGAQGIAQFMPETAKLRALDDPFNPAKALLAAARYLTDLRNEFGNLGLAAAAYNGGEGRIERWVASGGTLPLETRAYVYAITGFPVERWRARPPADPDFRLEPARGFQDACRTLARGRNMKEFRVPDELMPWVVVLAVNPDRQVVRNRASALEARLGTMLGEHEIRVGRARLPGSTRKLSTALIGAPNQAQATELCNQLRARHAGCMALKNRGFYEALPPVPVPRATPPATMAEADATVSQGYFAGP